MPKRFYCGDCGGEQYSHEECKLCRSLRLISISLMDELLGKDWRITRYTEEHKTELAWESVGLYRSSWRSYHKAQKDMPGFLLEGKAATFLGMSHLTVRKRLPAKKVLRGVWDTWTPTGHKLEKKYYRYYDEKEVDRLKAERDKAKQQCVARYATRKLSFHLSEEDISIPSTWWLQARKIMEAMHGEK